MSHYYNILKFYPLNKNLKAYSHYDKLPTFNNFLISADKMDEPIQFALNQPFPFPELIPPIDGTRTIPGLGFSALMVCVENPRPIEIEIFTNNPIRYGVYASENIPYFLLEFSKTPWVVEGSFHVIGSDGNINEWLDDNSNTMSCFLIDCNTHLLKAMRVFSVVPDVI